MMLEKELDNAQISNLLYTHDVLIDIVYEYSRTIPFKTRLHLDGIVEYARSTGKEMFKHITPAHFTENKRVMYCIDDYNSHMEMQEISDKWDDFASLIFDLMEDYIKENPSVTKLECKELFRYAKWSGKEEYKNLEYDDFTDEYILDRMEEFNRELSGYYDK